MPGAGEARAAAQRLGAADDQVARILHIAGARALALDAFLRVSRVEWSETVATACIECADRPRLLLNAAFVERRCHTPERLATLLLHELAHMSMGHTRMYPAPTVAHNIACDAIINREIATLAAEKGADASALTALLTECYPPHEAPWFLLRPPPAWPHAPQWEASQHATERLRAIHRRLYDPEHLGARLSVQYGEIVEALLEAAAEGAGAAGAGHANEGQDNGSATTMPKDCSALLGAHGHTATEQRALTSGRDAMASDMFGTAMEPLAGRLAGPGGDAMSLQVQRVARRAALERALTALLRRCVDVQSHQRRVRWDERPSRSVMPHRDRRAPARIALAQAYGAPRPLLFTDVIRRAYPEPQGATIYLDTSGSMHDVLPALHAALVALRAQLRPRILLFSTVVAESSAADFDAGRLSTTGGTDIVPVVKHLLHDATQRAARGDTAPRSVVLLTDGWFPPPSARLERALAAHRVHVHIGVMGNGPTHEAEPWVASATRLPSL